MSELLDGMVGEAAMVIAIDGDLAGKGQDVVLGIGASHVINLAHCNGVKNVGRVGTVEVIEDGVQLFS